ncbi:hypothetical protein ZOSMA_3G00760 [Zostera marina]|uniref:Uncharacterized protein n=1 Tax=Zostera marina TaxID=29655 RepID=A0A0K9P5Y1_ZOSMR|nr:hypothetical protein ZOSMA_3G00760 [Zostera marina]
MIFKGEIYRSSKDRYDIRLTRRGGTYLLRIRGAERILRAKRLN